MDVKVGTMTLLRSVPALSIAIAVATAGILVVSSCVAHAPPTRTTDPRRVPVGRHLSDARAKDGSFISWKEHLIDDEKLSGGIPLRGTDGLQVADLDKDGYLDIVSVHEDSHHIRIAFGSRDPDKWTLLTIAEGPEAGGAEDSTICDLNMDGFPDIVAACERAHLIYFQNPGHSARTKGWERVIPPLCANRGSFIRVFGADLDGDGRPEIVAANKGEQYPTFEDQSGRKPKEISWFRVPANPLDGALWEEHVLTRVLVPINSQPVDLDGDGDIDIIGGSAGEGRIMWFENTTVDGHVSFVEHPIEVTGRHVPHCNAHRCMAGFMMDFADLNGDGRLDILLAENDNLLVWIEQPPVRTEPWQIHLIGDITPDVLTGLTLADINGDGVLDIIAGGYSWEPYDRDVDRSVDTPAGLLTWFERVPGSDEKWIRHDISRRKRGMFDQFVARDIDGDGDIDFYSTRGNSWNYDGVFWLEQVRTRSPRQVFTPARRMDSEEIPGPDRHP